MVIIIRDQLANPPSSISSFRELTMICHYRLTKEIVIESEDPDPYWRWLGPRGCMDFVKDFVRPGTEDGVRVDVKQLFPRTIVIDRIVPENVIHLLGRLKWWF